MFHSTRRFGRGGTLLAVTVVVAILSAACGSEGGSAASGASGEAGSASGSASQASGANSASASSDSASSGSASATSGSASASVDAADSWKPDGQIHMIVPFSPGGGSDIFGRAVANGLQQVDSLNVVTENRTGGSGAVGYAFIRAHKGDGNYLLAAETSLVTLPLTTKLPYTWKTFTPLMQLAADNNMLLVAQDSPIKNLDDVVSQAKDGSFRMGISGTSSPDAVVSKLFQRTSDVKFREVVVQSGGELVTQVLGGSIDGAILNPGEAGEQIKAGKMRAIAVFSDSRLDAYPDVPTAKQQGIDVSFGQWRGIVGPPELTQAQIDYWTDALTKYTQSDDYAKYLEQNDLVKQIRSHDEFVTYLGTYETQVKQALNIS